MPCYNFVVILQERQVLLPLVLLQVLPLEQVLPLVLLLDLVVILLVLECDLLVLGLPRLLVLLQEH